MDLFLNIYICSSGTFLLAGRRGRNNSPWKESVAGKKIMLKIVSENFIHALLLFLGFFSKFPVGCPWVFTLYRPKSSQKRNEIMANFGSDIYSDDKVARKPRSLVATFESVINEW